MKSKNFLLITAVIVGFSLMSIPTAQGKTGVFAMDCYLWRMVEGDGPDFNLLYIHGLIDGLYFSGLTIQGQKILTESSQEHLKKSVDQFCEDYANEFIPIPFALKVITMKFKGVDDAAIQKELEKLRRTWYALRKENTQHSTVGQKDEFAGFPEVSRPVPYPREAAKGLDSTPTDSGEQKLGSGAPSWTTLDDGQLHRYLVQGTTVYGHMLAFVKREGQCDIDIMLIKWSAQGSVPELRESWIAIELTVGHKTVPITLEFLAVENSGSLNVMLMGNYFADQKLIDLLATGTTAKVKLTGPSELVEAVDIPEDSFSLHNFTESRTRAAGSCKAHGPETGR